MANAMLDARHEGDSYRRIEVITGERRRRHWTAEEKARIVAESLEEGANISEVARAATALPVGCSRCGDTSLRRRQASPARASCRSGSMPKAPPRRPASRALLRQRRRGRWRWYRGRQSPAARSR
jgi:transposase-like protein